MRIGLALSLVLACASLASPVLADGEKKAPAAASSGTGDESDKPRVASGASDATKSKLKSRHSRRKWPRSASAGFLVAVVLVTGGVWWWMKSREA